MTETEHDSSSQPTLHLASALNLISIVLVKITLSPVSVGKKLQNRLSNHSPLQQVRQQTQSGWIESIFGLNW
jgi:hypothetical protein